MKINLLAAMHSRTNGVVMVVLVVMMFASPSRAPAQSRDLFKDPLLRGELDPFTKLRSIRTQPEDGKIESIRYPDNDPAWLDFLKQYGGRPEMVYLVGWNRSVQLPDFPANTSERTRAELDYLLDLQSHRTEQHLKAITREVGNGLDSLGWLLNERFDLKKMPATTRLLGNAMRDVLAVCLSLKKTFMRPSPVVLEPRLKPCIEVPPYPAYPSGHSTQMYVLAFIFGDMMPDAQADFEVEAFRVAWDREMAGVQYPSDTAAGHALSLQLMDLMRNNPAYQADFKAAMIEWMKLNGKKEP